MLRNYLIVAIRNLLKNKLFTAINILGLALGLASSFMVYIYIYYHNSFDSKYKHSNICRVLTDTYTTDNQFVRQFAFSMHFLGPAVQKEFPEVEASVRMFEYETILVYFNNKIFSNKTVIGADSNVLHFFNFPLHNGNPGKALTEPNTAVITRSMARLLFGHENPLGRTIGLGYGFHEPWQYKITGVMDDLPVNTHMRADVLTSAIGSNSFLGRYTIFEEGAEANYYYPMFDTYLKIRAGTNFTALEKKLNNFLPQRIGKILENYGQRKLHLQPVTDIHFRKHADPDYLGGMERRSLSRANEIDPRTIKWISYGALILLVFSIFNYVNLTYLNSISRSKEIGMRKIFGAGLGRLFIQFVIESLLLTACAFLIALVLILSLVNLFYKFLDLPSSFTLLDNYHVYVFFLVFIGAVVLIQSSVLFLILLSADVTRLQRGDQSATRRAGGLRRVLMAAQLIVSFVLIAGTLLLGKQITYFLNKDLGFDNSNMLIIRKYTMATGLASIDLNYLKSFKNELKKSPYIEDVCLSTITPGFYYNTSQRVWLDQHITFQANTIYQDPDYQHVYNLKLLAGRYFTDDYKREANNVIINRKLMNKLKFDNPADVIGQTLYVDEEASNHVPPGAKKIIGVLENFYQEPLSNEIAPIKFHLFDSNRGFYSIRFKKGVDTRKAVNYVKNVFTRFYPKDNLDYYFLDDFMKQQYKSDTQIRKIMEIYTTASILVAYLGLLAFSVYLIRVRKKSIAIRKVLGARAPNVLMLLVREYLSMLLVSFIIAIPLTILVINQLFQSYTYRTNMGWITFLISAVILTAVVIGTIARQAVKVTVENPVKALRYE